MYCIVNDSACSLTWSDPLENMYCDRHASISLGKQFQRQLSFFRPHIFGANLVAIYTFSTQTSVKERSDTGKACRRMTNEVSTRGKTTYNVSSNRSLDNKADRFRCVRFDLKRLVLGILLSLNYQITSCRLKSQRA